MKLMKKRAHTKPFNEQLFTILAPLIFGAFRSDNHYTLSNTFAFIATHLNSQMYRSHDDAMWQLPLNC